jgi:L-fuculose-phosphate aldolase
MTQSDEQAVRGDVAHHALRMLRSGLVSGTSGNLSGRLAGAETCFVTPSGVDYESLKPRDLVAVGLDGSLRQGQLKPSVDTPIHVAIYRARPEVGAIIHTHSPYAAALSTLHRPIPPLLAESAGLLGGPVRVLAYVPPARDDTGDAVAEGLGGDRAVLLPNHGVIAVGENPRMAFLAAAAVEESARIACIVAGLAAIGDPHLVPADEVARMHDFIHNRYGQR